MSFTKRLSGYVSTLLRTRAEQAMDPEVEIEQAISEARQRDQALRNQAAKVLAHRTLLDRRIDEAADDVGEARELAKQALMKAEQARAAGDTDGTDKWTRAAQSLALRLEAAEQNLNSLKQQYAIAVDQAEDAKEAVQQNAMRVQELSARRMQLLGSLQQAKMQETVNRAVESMSATLDTEAPTLGRVEEKISMRLSEAQAKAELRSATPEGAETELRQAVTLTRADARLDQLRAELGLGTAGELSSGSTGELPPGS